jgi:hypothetical protein
MWAHLRNGLWNPKGSEHETKRKMPKNKCETMMKISLEHTTKNMRGNCKHTDMTEMDELSLLPGDIHKAKMSKEEAVREEITLWQKIKLVRLVLTLAIINKPRETTGAGHVTFHSTQIIMEVIIQKMFFFKLSVTNMKKQSSI